LLAISMATQAAETPLVPDHPLGNGLSKENRLALEFIAIHDESLHPAIFAVVERGNVLVQLPTIWQNFDVAMGPLLAPFSDEQRQKLQNLMRHPGLVESLVELGPRNQQALSELLANYPEEIRETAQNAAINQHALLVKVVRLLRTANEQLEQLLAPLPESTRDAFREVSGQPELTAALLEHMEVSERLGGAYRVDAATTQAQLLELGRIAWAEQERREAEEARQREARRLEEERQAQRRRERRSRSTYWGGYGRWNSSCWYGDPWYGHRWDRWHGSWNRCWYPWHGYRRRWW